MSVLNAIFMAILQAITMVLPSSEIGHIVLFNNFAGRQQNSFSQINGWVEIGIAIGIVIALYKPFLSLIKEFLGTFKELFTNRDKLKNPTPSRKFFYMAWVPMLFPALWAIPVGKGYNIYNLFSSFNFDRNVFSEGLFFLLTSAFLIVTYIYTNKNKNSKKQGNISLLCAILYGFAMIISVPVGGLSYVVVSMLLLALFGVNTKLSFRYTYVLAVPMLIINGIINICISINNESAFAIIVGLIISIIVSFFAVKISKRVFVKNVTDKFALYNLSIGVIATIIGTIQFFVK